MADAILASSGIYAITNIINGKKYIGSAFNLSKRMRSHAHMLDADTHPNSHLLNAWKKHGRESFTFDILFICRKDEVLFYEQIFIDKLDAFNSGYNLRPKAENNGGLRHSQETRDKISKSRTGFKDTKQTISKRAKAMTGLKRSDETKARMSIAQTGKEMSLEARAKMSARIYTKEHREKMRSIKTGTVMSDATRAKMSASHKARKIRLKSEHLSSD